MILFISAREAKPQSPINERFGRCEWLIKFDTETNEWESFENPAAGRSGGAGVAAAQFVIDHKADAVISGAFGPNASSAFRAGNVTMKLFGSEVFTVEQAAEFCLQDKLESFA